MSTQELTPLSEKIIGYNVHGVTLNDDDWIEVSDENASRFGLYAIVLVENHPEFRHLTDFDTRHDAELAKNILITKVQVGQVHCMAHEGDCPTPVRNLVLLSCSGGAIGPLYLCPELYKEHIVKGGDDGGSCGICC